MAIYRTIHMSFWTDSKIIDDFTPEERYFYIYLMTNPHTNLAGCYEISLKNIADETGYSKEKVEKLITKLMDTHKVILYSSDTKELMILKWNKYNWTQSENFRKCLFKEIEKVKNADFKAYLTDLYNGMDTVSIPYVDRMGTTVSVTVTDTVSDTDTKDKKQKYGEYQHVLLSEKDFENLRKKHSDQEIQEAIDYLDYYIEEKKYKSDNHKLTIMRWVFDAVAEKKQKARAAPGKFNLDNFLLDEMGVGNDKTGCN